LTEQQARAWGLYISKRVKQHEPEIFSEPGAFLIRPNGTLYAEFQSTAPWLRLDFDILLRGVQVAIQRGTPPRGGE
ncbi:MAG: AhpC/TSA family protein, partial [Alphaproteobacteria bacterium]|nr:AhpC/TSA family protein [Alphaproteobacteria bacterium]